MNGETFDGLTRTLNAVPTRRGFLRSVVSILLMTEAAISASSDVAARHKKHKKHKHKHKHDKKPKKNDFGCLDVGQACSGKDDQCCSGICEGKKPKKGEKDKSKCVAHNTSFCQPGIDACLGIELECTGGFCFQTTGKAPFCAGGTGVCTDCQKDTDCQELGFGAGSACVFCPIVCPETGGTVCFPAGS